ncbi:site-specific integrase [Janthinobacterium sp. SUN176]|uniref:site-specific integrase n=1 Tax=Janthinobacterium sp. SUN176 TaxID=3014788 RepID=UPI002712A0AD|nr:site-specific integrase [Janthinobacterium sp. SUN176]MDO8074758.1 site-specific integrase [Janthinobacterium sp. SUN176]
MNKSPKLDDKVALNSEHRLPDLAFTLSGVGFRPNDDVWLWLDGPFKVKLDFCRFDLPTTIPVFSLKYTLYVFAKTNAPSYVCNLFAAFVHFLAQRGGTAALTSITAMEVSNYFARLGEHEKWRIGTLNVLLQKWQALGLVGVDSECTQYLRERRKPGNTKGAAVRQRDPFAGPFCEEEYTALYKAVDTAYGTGDIPRWAAVLVRLLFACGGRISQYASLKGSDFNVKESTFVLNLPQAKTGSVHGRVSFIEFFLSPQTGRLVLEHIDSHRAQGLGDEAPLFLESEVMARGPREQLRAKEDLFFGHCTQLVLSKALTSVVSAIAPPTSRLDFAPIPVNAKRFRSTFGTRLAEEGASRAQIAERLGHADLQNVDVYFEGSPTIIENIDNALSHQLAPLARAFKGRVVEDEEHSTHKGASGSRIIDFRISAKPLASCAGKGKECFFDKPVACYTCFRFEPWLDGPHEQVLERLQKEREKWIADERIAAINDDAIVAIREVMAECDQINAQQKTGGIA